MVWKLYTLGNNAHDMWIKVKCFIVANNYMIVVRKKWQTQSSEDF